MRKAFIVSLFVIQMLLVACSSGDEAEGDTQTSNSVIVSSSAQGNNGAVSPAPAAGLTDSSEAEVILLRVPG